MQVFDSLFQACVEQLAVDMPWLGRRFETVLHRVIWFLICWINAIGSYNEHLGYFRYERRSIEGREIRDLG
jgi:hypothetical protein